MISNDPETNQTDFEICKSSFEIKTDQKLHEITKRAFILKRYGIIMKIDASSYFDHASENIDCKSFAIRNKISPSEGKIVNSLKTLHFSN